MKIFFNGLISQNGDDLPVVTEVGVSGFEFDVEFEKDTEGNSMPGNFFFVSPGNFALGKCALMFNQSDNVMSIPSNIIVDHNYSEPDKIKVATVGYQEINGVNTFVPRNEIFNRTPFQLVVDLDLTKISHENN